MKALVFHKAKKVTIEQVADPKIYNPDDAIVKVTSLAICGTLQVHHLNIEKYL